MIDQIENMGKDTVIAVIERRGEVIYYKTTKMSFFENKKRVRFSPIAEKNIFYYKVLW